MLKKVYSGLLEDTIQTYRITDSLLSQINDCSTKLSSIYDVLPDDHPLYKDLVDLEKEAMYDPTIYNKSFPDNMSRDVISNLSERVPLDDAIKENEVKEELDRLRIKGGFRRHRNKKSKKSKKSKKGRKGRKTRKGR
jgi:hypothetical protein